MSKNIKVNGKECSSQEALDLIEQEDMKITNLSIGLDNKDKKKSEPSHEGFELTQEFISSMSKTMDEFGASRVVTRFNGSSKIMNRNLIVIMADPEDEINAIMDALSNDEEEE